MFYEKQHLETTVGRVILNDRLPDEMPFINGLLKKRGLSRLVAYCYLNLGREKTVEMLDELKELGFQYATRSGCRSGSTTWLCASRRRNWLTTLRRT